MKGGCGGWVGGALMITLIWICAALVVVVCPAAVVVPELEVELWPAGVVVCPLVVV